MDTEAEEHWIHFLSLFTLFGLFAVGRSAGCTHTRVGGGKWPSLGWAGLGGGILR